MPYVCTVFDIHVAFKQCSTYTFLSYGVPHTLYRFKQGSTFTLPFQKGSTFPLVRYRVRHTLPFQTGFDIHFRSIQGSTFTFVSNRVPHTLSFHTVFHIHFTEQGKQGSTYTLPFQTGFHIHFPFIRCSTYTLPF